MTRTAGTYAQGASLRFMDVGINPVELKSGALVRRFDQRAYPRVGVTSLVDVSAALVVAPAGSQVAATVLTLTATVTPSEEVVVRGSVAFKDGATTLATVPLTKGGQAVTTTTLAVGAHTLTAEFTSTNNHGSAISAGVVQTAT